MRMILFSVLILFSLSSWAQYNSPGSDWLYGPGQDWAYEPGSGLTMDAQLGNFNTQLTNPSGTIAKSDGFGGKFGFYMPYLVKPSFDFGFKLSARWSSLENGANTAALSETSEYFGIGPGVELRFYRFVAGVEYYFDEASFETSGAISTNTTINFQSTHYYVGIDIPIRPFQLRVLWQKGSGSFDAADTGLSQDSSYEEEAWFIGIRYSTDFGWQKFKDSLL